MIITLCGSTRFESTFKTIARDLTLKGNVVLTVNVFSHSGTKITEAEKIMLSEIHRKKIDLSDAIFVLNVNGYIGDATKDEIEYAKKNNKKVFYLE